MLSMDRAYREHAETVYRYLLSLTHDPETAEELAQETFYQAVRCADRFDGSCKVSTWLCAIAKNQLYAYNRKHPPTEELDGLSAETGSAEAEAMDGIGRTELLRRMHGLSEPLREVMYLRLFGSLPFRDIGDVFGKTENWARVTYYRGKERLRREIEENG